MAQDIEIDLRKFLVDDLLVDMEARDIPLESSLRNDLAIDSLGFLELSAFVQKRYSISIAEEEFIPDNFGTLKSLITFIEHKTDLN